MSKSDANIYAISRLGVQQEFSEYCSGSPEGLAVVVCSKAVSAAAQDALTKSFERLGYGTHPVTTVCIEANTEEADTKLYRLIEGLDPRALVACDKAATQMCNAAYRVTLPTQGQGRVMGRDIRTFEQLDELLQSEKGKQAAWSLLKTLPEL